MKKILQIATLVVSLLCIFGMICWGLYCINDYNALVSDQSASGIDYMMLGFTYSVGFLIMSLCGMVSSLLCKKYSEKKWIDIICYVSIGACSVGILVAAFLWFKWSWV